MILFNENSCIDICLKNSNEYVLKAAEDLRNDFARVSKEGVLPKFINEESDFCIVIEDNTKKTADPVSDESYTVKTEGNKIRISAPTYLGTMWGIYTISEKYLGVDPCYLFNDLAIVKKDSIETGDIDICEQPNGFGFRGVFINDEDLLTGWKDGGGIRYMDYIWYFLTVEESVMNRIVETMLRLKLNLVIPASFLDIDNPPEKLLADCVARRGIYLSQHHVEPVGLSSFTFDTYCRKYKKSGKFSFVDNPDVMTEAWEFYAKKWAEYDNVVWQIGLRGEGDRPLWGINAKPTDEDLKKYGGFISNAYQKQKDIIMNATGGKAKHFTSTLWMEGSELLEKGFLKFPEDTVIVFADTGVNQMYGSEFYSITRDKNSKYGIYYHLQYFGAGPHLAPQTGIDKLHYNTKLAYEKGDKDYYILNVSNVREFTFELKAYSEMLWNFEDFSKDEYVDRYCEKFGSDSGEMKRLIKEYYGNFPWLEAKNLLETYYGKFFNFYLVDNPDGIRNFILKDGDLLDIGSQIIRLFHRPLPAVYIRYYHSVKGAVSKYMEICGDLEKLTEKLEYPLDKHVEVKWLLSAKTLLCIYRWFANVYEAKVFCDKLDTENMKNSLQTACKSLEEYLNFRKCAEYGEFENWYRGDLKTDVKQKLYNTKKLLGHSPDLH